MSTNAIALFADAHSALAGARALKAAGHASTSLISPIPIEEAHESPGGRTPVIRRFTLFGAILGGLSGFALAAGTAVVYLHPTGGRPIITFPPFLIITYEMTILFGILATVIGFLVSTRLPAIRERAYPPEAAVDCYAVVVECDGEERLLHAIGLMREAGAQEIRQERSG